VNRAGGYFGPRNVLKVVDTCADSGSMENVSIDDLRGELAVLEARAARLSAQRSHLHHQIDFGFETSTSREREREVSDERIAVHRRIDELRELVRAHEDA
jgi:hypothetical protein